VNSEIARFFGGGVSATAVLDRFNYIHKRDARFLQEAIDKGIDPINVEVGIPRNRSKNCMGATPNAFFLVSQQ